MIKRKGRFGQFLGCSGYPDCKTIINLDKAGNPLPPKAKPIPTAVKCEKCGGQMVLRDGSRIYWWVEILAILFAVLTGMVAVGWTAISATRPYRRSSPRYAAP